MATLGVQPLCLTWIPAVWTLRHVLLGETDAQPAASCLSRRCFFPPFLAQRIHDAHCWLICRPGENVFGSNVVVFSPINYYLARLYCFDANNDCICPLLIGRLRIWLPIHPGKPLDRQSSPSATLNSPTGRWRSASRFTRVVPVLISSFIVL